MSYKKNIVGVDEVGRGCLAGPVIAAAVILKKNINTRMIIDSKKLNFNERVKISNYIKKNSWYGIGVSQVKEIDFINILQATLLAMKRAINKLQKKPSSCLIDGIHIPKDLKNAKSIIKGDAKIKCISAASIVAKVYRDFYMIKLSKKFPQYSWNKNFGYGTKDHLKALSKFGITKHHRKNFKPVHNILMRSN